MPRTRGAESTAPRQYFAAFSAYPSWGQTPDANRELTARIRNALTEMGIGVWIDDERLVDGNVIQT